MSVQYTHTEATWSRQNKDGTGNTVKHDKKKKKGDGDAQSFCGGDKNVNIRAEGKGFGQMLVMNQTVLVVYYQIVFF